MVNRLKPAFYQIIRVLNAERCQASHQTCKHVRNGQVTVLTKKTLEILLQALIERKVDKATGCCTVEAGTESFEEAACPFLAVDLFSQLKR